MKRVVLLLGLALLSFNTAYAEVSKFVFVTEPQSIPTGTSSETITVQAQNADGVSENITETNDIVFTSSSQTGEFLSTTGNPVTTTMSKNTANKNFLYRDSTPGTYTITVKATGRTSLNSFSASQEIVVGGDISQNNESTNETSSTTTEETDNTKTQVVIVYSAHSSPAPLSTTENKIDFEISAGRDRLTSTGSSLVFKAGATKVQNVSEQNISYSWSFGDGTTAQGSTVTHAYRFPGNYVVVVNGNYSDKQAVSRLSVKVVSPEILVSRVLGGFEIANKSKYEINLEDWVISNDNKKFVYPVDTLIAVGDKIIFTDEVTGLSDGDIKILNPLGKLVASLDSTGTVAVLEKAETHSLEQIQAKLDEVKNTIAMISPLVAPPSVPNPPVPVKNAIAYVGELENKVDNTDQLASAIKVFEAPVNTSISSKILLWPARGIEFIKHLFVEE